MKLFFSIFISLLLFTSCNQSTNDYKKGYQDGYADGIKANSQSNNDVVYPNQPNKTHNPNTSIHNNENKGEDGIPQKVYSTLKFIKENNKAPDGFVGGRHFGNYEHLLPEHDAAGNKIDYQEWDVNAKQNGKNRGAQRLVTGNDGRAWFTNNHYKSFTEVK
jgi:ribonuclease T1